MLTYPCNHGGIAVLKRIDQWNVRVFYAALIALMVAMFVWFFHNRLVEASFFFALSVACAVLVYRVVSQSERAFTVMLWTLFLKYLTLISRAGPSSASRRRYTSGTGSSW